MRSRAGDEDLVSQAAETVPGCAVRTALTRAERTGRIIVIHDVIIGSSWGNGNRGGT